MKLETIKLTELTPDPTNARKHDEANLKAIQGSLSQFGQRKPIVISQSNVIVAGNGTVEAAKRLGWTDIQAVRVPSDWDADRIKAFALADNRTAELADWSPQILAEQLLEIEQAGFDIEAFGFEKVEPLEDKSKEEDDVLPEEVETRVKLGQLWQLGNHRLLCGDSTDKSLIDKLINGQKIELVFTDPPYRQGSSGGDNDFIGKAINKTTETIAHMIDFDPVDFLSVLPTVFQKETMNSYIFCNKELVPEYLNWAIQNKYSFNILFWKKPNALPLASSHRPDVEYLIFIRKNAIWNNSLPDTNYSKCLEYGRDNSTPHPTMKPIELIIDEIKISSNPKSNIMDFYGGSGSTLIAAEKTNRNCYMMELDPKYCDVIIQRWENLTGQRAELVNASR